jgi:hypothetical protein
VRTKFYRRIQSAFGLKLTELWFRVNAAGDGVKAVAVPTIRAVMATANFIFDLLCAIIGEERREVVVWSRRDGCEEGCSQLQLLREFLYHSVWYLGLGRQAGVDPAKRHSKF